MGENQKNILKIGLNGTKTTKKAEELRFRPSIRRKKTRI
jgi:hypothetical protein